MSSTAAASPMATTVTYQRPLPFWADDFLVDPFGFNADTYS